MRANRGRKFKAPRLLKDKETAKQNESDEEDIPFSEIREMLEQRQRSVIMKKTFLLVKYEKRLEQRQRAVIVRRTTFLSVRSRPRQQYLQAIREKTDRHQKRLMRL